MNLTKILFLLIFFLIFISCKTKITENEKIIKASKHYNKYNDFKSLKIISRHLKIGMSKEEVANLLGAPHYSPIDGQYYYSSESYSSGGCVLGLVLEFRKIRLTKNDNKIIQTGKLEEIYVGEICE